MSHSLILQVVYVPASFIWQFKEVFSGKIILTIGEEPQSTYVKFLLEDKSISVTPEFVIVKL